MMRLISREELKEKLDRKDSFKLVMTLDEQAFKEGRIPGSIHINNMEQAEGVVSPADEIVVYCHDENCPASKTAYQLLVSHGFSNVRRYAGGMRDWQEAGFSIEQNQEAKKENMLPTRLSISISKEDHRQGQVDAAIQVVVYGDYECPYTRRAMTHVKGLQRQLGDRLCFVYRHFPAPGNIHPHAWIASEAALVANAQGKFWAMHNHLFKHQKALTHDDLLAYASELGLDVDRVIREMEGHVFNGRIKRDRRSGWDSGVRSIPTLFINDVRYAGEMKLKAILSAMENV